MKLQDKLAMGAGSAFTVSFFLPALDTNSGYSCFVDCWRAMFRSDDSSLGGWLYYSGFVLANALFVALWATLFFSVPYARTRLWISIAASAQVVSWFILNLVGGDELSLGAGYYLWLLSYLLLVASYVTMRKEAKRPAHRADRS
jgi:hypothetical protein